MLDNPSRGWRPGERRSQFNEDGYRAHNCGGLYPRQDKDIRLISPADAQVNVQIGNV